MSTRVQGWRAEVDPSAPLNERDGIVADVALQVQHAPSIDRAELRPDRCEDKS